MNKMHFIVNSSVIILNENNEILLQKRSLDEDKHPGKWGIPGGKLDNTDKTLEIGLKREVREEVDIEIKNLELIDNHMRITPSMNKLYLVYTAEYESGEPKALDGTDQVDWFKIDDLPDKESFTPYTFDLIRKVDRLLQNNKKTC